MGKVSYKIGDVVCLTKPMIGNLEIDHKKYNCVYGNIVDIILFDIDNIERSFNEIDLITGHGDRNTKCKFIVDVFGYYDLYTTGIFHVSNKMLLFENKERISWIHTHDIFKFNKKDFEKKSQNKINIIKENLDIFNRYSMTLDDKINIILD